MSDDRENLDFGPSGYLPERASKRARKIVLRAPLGMHWIWAAVVAGAIVLIAGILFLERSGDGPSAPFEAVAPLVEVTNGEVRDVGPGGAPLLLVTEGGRPRAFALDDATSGIGYCERSRRIEHPDGRVWSLTGRGLGGTPSLSEHPTLVSDGVVYLDPTTTLEGPPPSQDAVAPGC